MKSTLRGLCGLCVLRWIGPVLAALATANIATAQPPPRPVNERGPANAPVTIVEFCTYDSDACGRLDIVLGGVLLEFGDRVRLVFHHVPADDTRAASLRYRAALAAGQQGQFWPMHGLLMANREHSTRADMAAMAHQLGLDAERFRTDLDSADTVAAASADRDEARVQNISTTPTLIVNGQSAATVAEAKDLRAAITLALAAR
jgi:protein-disulfide isomerase